MRREGVVRTLLLACVTLSFGLLNAITCAGEPGDPPNILVVLADDQGWGDLSVHGNHNLSTPNIDRLAADGALFERFYVSPLCAPTRAEFLTGRYHPRTGVHGVTTGAERMNLNEYTIAQAFRAAGYATAIFGKWHNGTQYPYHPLARGFQEFYGFTSGHWGIYFDPPLESGSEIVRGRGYITDDLTDHAIDFIKRHRTEPFFCYVAYNTPHTPLQVPDQFYEKFARAEIAQRYHGKEREDIEFTRAVLAMCENIDWNVGRLLQALRECNLESDTIVVYFSDNGPNSWRWNGGMRGRKGSTDEGGVRVPCIIRWPGHVPAGMRVAQIAAAIDLFPTLASLAGLSCKAPLPMDGIDLSPVLLGKQKFVARERLIFAHQAGQVSVRNHRFVLDNRGRLYDLLQDPGQTEDVSAQFPDVAKSLRKAVEQFKEEVLPKEPDTRPFPVGYTEFPVTYLPARDGVPHGGIERSAKAPNCSFFTNWTSPEDSITWDIEVHTAGQYEVVVYYTCRPEDVGVVVRASFAGRNVEGKITEPFDPPLHGHEFDRVPRQGESYVKDFKPFVLGMIQLPAQRGLLELRAVNIPGDRAIDLRWVKLTLKSADDTSRP
ncbi:arylsulfatase [Thermogutta sp.]|jgi:arylsulfatase A-like enzyme|uniref:arylsulfatase n=1 Tax=Thermogutta sp. TaxID=1962930 RepID=UPI00322015B3